MRIKTIIRAKGMDFDEAVNTELENGWQVRGFSTEVMRSMIGNEIYSIFRKN